MIPIKSTRIVKIVYFGNTHMIDCVDGGFTNDTTRARFYDDEEPDDQILAYYNDWAGVMRVKITVETSIKDI